MAALAILAFSGPFLLESPRRGPGLSPGNVPIRHVVIVMMENHAFDNLFGTYCPFAGPHCQSPVDGIPAGTCVPYDPNQPSLGCVRPYAFGANELTTRDPAHSWNSSIRSIDQGAMDGFYLAENLGRLPFGHYNGSTIPLYWDLAQAYGIGDGFFSSALSYSLPNHWYLLAGQTPPVGVNQTDLGTVSGRHAYLNEANQTRSVQDLLNGSPSVSWKYYDSVAPAYSTAINGPAGVDSNSAYDYWDPLLAKAESYSSWYVSHFAARSDIFNDSAAGRLPNVSWVIPGFTFSDHPAANLSRGEEFVASLVDAIETSPDWSSTAIFVTWDDYGGFYDHVAPPRIDPLGLSFRVPLLVISPYTPAGVVVHDLGYFDSLLHFVEWRFQLGCITSRDCGAPLPLGYFDFSMSPRAPLLFPTAAVNATYPLGALTVGGAAAPAGALGPVTGCEPYCVTPSLWDTPPPPPGTPVTAVD